eukprot:3542548-Pyramimonas_sp.AAC.1
MQQSHRFVRLNPPNMVLWNEFPLTGWKCPKHAKGRNRPNDSWGSSPQISNSDCVRNGVRACVVPKTAF